MLEWAGACCGIENGEHLFLWGKGDTTEMETQFVVFELAGESYGVDIGRVQEIDRMTTITVIPEAPAYVEGVMNLRGRTAGSELADPFRASKG